MKKIFLFLSEETGKLSFMRISAFLLILTYIFSAVYILIMERKFIDIPVQLAALIAILYGINKFSNHFKGNKK